MNKKRNLLMLISLSALLLVMGCTQTTLGPGQITPSEVILSQVDSISIADLNNVKYGSQINEFLINNWTVSPNHSAIIVCNKGADIDENSSWLYCNLNIERINKFTDGTVQSTERASLSLTIKPSSTYQVETGKAFLGRPIYEAHYVYDIFNVEVTEQ